MLHLFLWAAQVFADVLTSPTMSYVDFFSAFAVGSFDGDYEITYHPGVKHVEGTFNGQAISYKPDKFLDDVTRKRDAPRTHDLYSFILLDAVKDTLADMRKADVFLPVTRLNTRPALTRSMETKEWIDPQNAAYAETLLHEEGSLWVVYYYSIEPRMLMSFFKCEDEDLAQLVREWLPMIVSLAKRVKEKDFPVGWTSMYQLPPTAQTIAAVLQQTHGAADAWARARMYQADEHFYRSSLRKAADAGHCQAQYEVAKYALLHGKHVDALENYRKASEQGHPQALIAYAELLARQGNGALAVQLLREASDEYADELKIQAWALLGSILVTMDDREQARDFLKFAADRGHKRSAYLYASDKTIPLEEALRYYGLATAAVGPRELPPYAESSEAAYRYGSMYLFQPRTIENHKRWLYWTVLAADNSHVQAAEALLLYMQSDDGFEELKGPISRALCTIRTSVMPSPLGKRKPGA